MKFLRNLQLRMRGVRVYALVGKSGTGKSFRARLVAEKESIDLMIDDGLVIRGQKILAGKSAKREKHYLAAVRTALFTDKEHLKQVLDALDREHFKRILIVGTSERMVSKIAHTLELPQPTNIIHIEDIATADEIATAIHMRHTQGRHIIPVPSIEVKNNNSGFVTESLKVFFRKGAGLFRRRTAYEKSVVRPEFSKKGAVSISEAALSQMILHCVDEFNIAAEVRKVHVKNEPSGYRLKLDLNVPFGEDIVTPVHELQTYIVDSIERFTGMIIEDLSISIESVSERQQRARDRKARDKTEEKGERRDVDSRKRKADHVSRRRDAGRRALLSADDDSDSDSGVLDPRNDGKPFNATLNPADNARANKTDRPTRQSPSEPSRTADR